MSSIIKPPIQDEYIEDYLANKDLDLTATLNGEEAYKNAEFVIIATPTNYIMGSPKPRP